MFKNIKVLVKFVNTVFVFVLLGSCSSFLSPGKNATKQFMIKDSKLDTQQSVSCPTLKNYKALMILNEDALAPFNSSSIFYVNSANQINKFAVNEWVSEPNIMISNNLQLRLSQSCLYSAVVPDKSFVPVNAKLSLQLIKLQSDFTDQAHPVEILEARVQLLNMNNSVDKWKSFRLEQPLKKADVAEVIKASNELVEQFDDQVITMLQQ